MSSSRSKFSQDLEPRTTHLSAFLSTAAFHSVVPIFPARDQDKRSNKFGKVNSTEGRKGRAVGYDVSDSGSIDRKYREDTDRREAPGTFNPQRE